VRFKLGEVTPADEWNGDAGLGMFSMGSALVRRSVLGRGGVMFVFNLVWQVGRRLPGRSPVGYVFNKAVCGIGCQAWYVR